MEYLFMTSAIKRKTSLTLDADVLDSAKELGLNVSAVAEAALGKAVADARRTQWLEENAQAFAAQAAWHEQHGHPLADILLAPGGGSWRA
jgi:antitoxin CcdA